jgi:hypothetical protein
MFEDTLDTLFGRSPLLQLVVFVINGLIDFGAGMLLIRFVRRYGKPEKWIPVATFQSTIVVVFALFLVFHAAGIWSNKSHAERTHIESGTAVKRLDDLLGPQQLNLTGIVDDPFRFLQNLDPGTWLGS